MRDRPSRLSVRCNSYCSGRTQVCWHGNVDVRDKFRNFRIFPGEVVIIALLVFFGVVARFRNEESSVGIGNISEFAGLEEFILEEDNIMDV